MKGKLFTEIDLENPFAKLYSWKAPERIWVPKTKAWYVSYAFFFVVLILLLTLIGEIFLIIAVLAFGFLWFIQGSIEPPEAEHTITNMGLRTYGKLFKWRNIKHFWFSKKDNTKILNLEVSEDGNPKFTKRISMIINKGEDDKIFDMLIKYCDYGDTDEIGYNFMMKLLHGKHIDIAAYMQEGETEDGFIKYPLE